MDVEEMRKLTKQGDALERERKRQAEELQKKEEAARVLSNEVKKKQWISFALEKMKEQAAIGRSNATITLSWDRADAMGSVAKAVADHLHEVLKYPKPTLTFEDYECRMADDCPLEQYGSCTMVVFW